MPKKVAINYFVDDEYSATVAVPRETTFETLRQQWMESSGSFSGPAYFFVKSIDGAPLPEVGSLEEVMPPKEHTLALHVVRAEEKHVRVFGSNLDSVIIQLLPFETTDALTVRVKRLLGIEEKRIARLLVRDRVLNRDIPPCVQLANSPIIYLDLQCPFLACFIQSDCFHPVLYDELTDEHVKNKDLTEEDRSKGVDPDNPDALPVFEKLFDVQALSLFASESIRSMAGPDDCRVIAWHSGKSVAADAAVCTLVEEAVLLSGIVSGVVIERRMELVIEEKLQRRTRKVSVWPSVKLSDLLTNSNDVILLDGQSTDPSLSLWETGLQSGACLCITRLLPIFVFDEKRTVKRVTADLGETLFELRQRLVLPEDAFELWAGGELLVANEFSLHELGLDTYKVLTALPKSRDVVLKAGKASSTSMGQVRKNTTFPFFLKAASEALATRLPSKTRFVCTCGRIYSGESAERREFPMYCCSATELCLYVEQPSKGE